MILFFWYFFLDDWSRDFNPGRYSSKQIYSHLYINYLKEKVINLSLFCEIYMYMYQYCFICTWTTIYMNMYVPLQLC